MRRHGLAYLIALCGSLGACTTTPVEIHDEASAQLEARGIYRWSEPDADEPWFGLAVQAGGSDGGTTQGLSAGDNVVLGEQSFAGPGRLAVDYQMRRVALGVAIGRETGDLQASAILGLAWQDLDLDLALGAQRAHENDRWVGTLTGVDFTWAATSWIGLAGRVALTTSLRAQSGELELAAAIAPRSPVTLLVGWRWLDAYSSLEGESDLDLGLRGPLIALRGTL